MKNGMMRRAEYKHWVVFNTVIKWGGFICFTLCGTMAATFMVDWLEINGPSEIKKNNPDEVLQFIVLGLPTLFGLFGWLIFRAKPFFPKKFDKSEQ